MGLASWCLGALMWVLAFLYTPTGRLPSRRWRVVVWAAIVGTLAYVVGWSFSPSSMDPLTGELNRFAVDWVPGQQLMVVGGTLLCLSAGGALASLVVRLRHADRTVRQQTSTRRAPANRATTSVSAGLSRAWRSDSCSCARWSTIVEAPSTRRGSPADRSVRRWSRTSSKSVNPRLRKTSSSSWPWRRLRGRRARRSGTSRDRRGAREASRPPGAPGARARRTAG